MKECECHSISKYISTINRHIKSHIGKELLPYNLGSGQYIFLMHLYKFDGINQEELSNLLNIDKATTARAIKKLEENGYVIRKQNPNDKRAYKIYLTEQAIKLKPIIKKTIINTNEVIETDISDDDKELLNKILKKMSDNAAKYL